MNRRRAIAILGIMVLITVFISCSTVRHVKQIVTSEKGPKKKIGLLGISDATQFEMEGYAHAMEKLLLEQMKKSGDLVVLAPGDLALLEDDSLISNGQIQFETLIPRAKQHGLNAVIQGSISELEIIHKLYGVYGFRREKPTLRLIVRLKLIDVETRTVLYEGYRQAKMKVDLPEDTTIQEYLEKNEKIPASFTESILKKMGSDIVSAMSNRPWRGYITEISSDRIKISAGSEVGLKSGEQLTVWGEGYETVNYAGRKFSLPSKKIGEVRCEKVEKSFAIAVIIDGEDIKVGDSLSLPN